MQKIDYDRWDTMGNVLTNLLECSKVFVDQMQSAHDKLQIKVRETDVTKDMQHFIHG